ncbi:Ff.00g130560.m01.CDS01 [Fusarium sp. VM40]|nr:Ff.00g130560.m01.CDS01 [Fusarium sp. VM40]
MAEAVGLAASIAGLVQLTGSVFKLVTKFCREAKDAPSKAQELATQTRELAGIFENLRLLASALETESSNPSLKTHHLDSCQRTLDEINTTLNKAQADFDSGKSAKRFSRRLKWPFSLSETKDLVSDLANHRATVQLALSADSMDALLKSLSKQDQILNLIERKLSFDTRVQLNKRRKEVMDFFLRVKPQDYLDVCRELRHEATGSWLTSGDSTFSEWIDGVNSKLWLSGIPGSGKTVLCGLVIETVLAQSDDSTAVCYAFCDYKNSDTCLPENIIAALAVQLGLQGEEAFDALEEYYDMLHPEDKLPMQPKLDDLLELIDCMAEVYDKVFVIVDGLDECGIHVSRMTQALRSVVDKSQTVSAAFFSRKEEEIREELEGQFEHIEVSAHTKDLEDYTLAEVGKRKVLKRLEETNPLLYKDILHTLVQGAQGMFRWVACQIDHICDQPNNNARKKALKELPPTLFGTYDRVLQNIAQSPPGTLACLQKALQWIALADYKMDIPMLCQAVSIQSEADPIEKDDIIDPEIISRRCGCLLRKSLDGKFFEFAHFTVLEYLTSSPVEGFRFAEESAYRSFAETSVRFILFPCFDRTPSLIETVEEAYREVRDREHPFYRVAAEIPYDLHCVRSLSHTRTATLEEEPALSLLKRLFSGEKNGHYQHWLRTVTQSITVFHEFSSSPWHLAAFLISPRLCEYILEQGAEVNAVHNTWTPLATAIFQIAKHGRKNGQESDGNEFWSHRHTQVLSILLDHGADVLFTRRGQSTLSAAFERLKGHDLLPFVRASIPVPEDAVATFSDRIWDEKSDDAFLQAVLDLSIGEDAPTQWKPMAAPALIHSRRRGLGVPGQIVNLPADTYTDEDYPKAFEVAIEAGYTEDLAALIADPRFHDEACRQSNFALLNAAAASRIGRSGETLKMLLDLGIDPSTVDSTGRNALHISCHSANFDVVGILLAHGVDSSKSDVRGQTPWHLAASNGREDLLKYLFQHDENAMKALKIANQNKETPLGSAFVSAVVEACLFLLEICPSEPAYYQFSVPPLEDAVMIGSKELFEALLAKGDIVTSTSTPSSNPMHFLSGKCTPQFARYLSTMYDPFALDASGCSPFQLFFERWLYLNEDFEKHRTILLDNELLRLLLPENFVFVRDTGSVHAWEIICHCICQAEVCCLIPKDDNGGASSDTKNDCEYYLAHDISTIFRCGILSSYENSQGLPGILPLIKSARRHHRAHFCESSFTSLIREILRVSSIKASFCDYEDYYGLFIRVMCGNHMRLLEELIGQEVDLLRRVPDSVSKTPKSLFEMGCERAQPGIFRLLLDNISLERLQVPGTSGRTPVELLVYGRSPDKARLLEALSEKGPVTMPENLECPLIVKAASDSEWNLVKGLARLGHDVSVKSSGGWGLAQYAVSQGDLDMFKWVMESVSETAQWQTLSFGSSESHPNRVRKQKIFDTQLSLLHMGGLQPHVLAYMLDNKLFSDVNIVTYNGRTPLHWAAFCGVETGCQMLIAQGADPSIRDKSGKLAIDYAHFHDYEEVVTMLLEAGSPQPEEQFTDEKQMNKIASAAELEMRRRVKFEKAIWDGDLDECEQAFLAGCSVDRPVPSCLCSPLFLSIRARQDHITARLLDQGASTLDNKCDHNVQKKLVAHAAVNIDSAALMKSILTASFKQQTIWHTGLHAALYIAIIREELESVKVILEHFNLHIKDYHNAWIFELGDDFHTDSIDEFRTRFISQSMSIPSGDTGTVLHFAVKGGDLAMVRTLISNGADVNALNKHDETPLMIAAENNHLTRFPEEMQRWSNFWTRRVRTLYSSRRRRGPTFWEYR